MLMVTFIMIMIAMTEMITNTMSGLSCHVLAFWRTWVVTFIMIIIVITRMIIIVMTEMIKNIMSELS